MATKGNRTFICSVVFLDIVEYSKQPISEQIRLKEAFTGLLADAIRDVAVNDRIILDTGDGAAISFLGDPEDALFVTLSLRDALAARAPDAAALQICIGINLGPVKLIKDINGQPNIIGDGINVAQRVMGFAAPGQILVSRSYYEVVSRLSDEYPQLFRYEGSRTDKHVREHEVYAVDVPAARRQLLAAPEHGDALENPDPAAGPKTPADAPPRPRTRRRLRIIVPLAMTAILAAAFGLRALRTAPPPPTPVVSAPALRPPMPAPAPQPPPVTTPQLPSAPAPKESRPETAAVQRRPAPAPAPVPVVTEYGFVDLAVSPWGEVYVDGKKRGVSPPLNEVGLAPGRHEIEIRNATFPVYRQSVHVKPGERVKIRHKFR